MPEPQFRSFDSIEDAFEFMRRGEDYGNRNLHPEQAGITWGDYWVRFYDVRDRLIIFGRVETEEEAAVAEGRDTIPDIEDAGERALAEAEYAETMRVIRDSHERGLMFGWAYSKIAHDLGSTHRFHMWPITPQLYEAAKAVDWDVDRLTDPRDRGELERAWQGYRAHMLTVEASGDKP